MEQDIRWKQRFSNYQKALEKLTTAMQVINHNMQQTEDTETYVAISEMLKEGLIQRFEYTHELAWNVMKDYIKYQGNNNIAGSRDATREALQIKLIGNGGVWMDMIQSRNDTLHTYNNETAEKVFTKIVNEYYPAFIEFEENMKRLLGTNISKPFEP